MISEYDNIGKFDVVYCDGWNYDRLVTYGCRSDKPERVCYATTDLYRIYVVFLNYKRVLTAHYKTENQWIKVNINPKLPKEVPDGCLEFENSFEQFLGEMLFKQFPVAAENYHGQHFKCNDVMQLLEASPYESTLVRNKLVYSFADDVRIDDADGLCTIWVDEGIIQVPYTLKKNESRVLQMYRAKLHSDQFMSYLGESICDKMHNLVTNHKVSLWGLWRSATDKIFNEGVNLSGG